MQGSDDRTMVGGSHAVNGIRRLAHEYPTHFGVNDRELLGASGDTVDQAIEYRDDDNTVRPVSPLV